MTRSFDYRVKWSSWTLNFSSLTRIRKDHRLIVNVPLQTEVRLLTQQLSSQIADRYGDIITEHSVKVHVLVRGAHVCDHWGGKETRPGPPAWRLRKESPLSRAGTLGGRGFDLLLSILGHNLKGDHITVLQSSTALILPHHPCLPLHSQPAYFPLFQTKAWTKNLTLCEQNIKCCYWFFRYIQS